MINIQPIEKRDPGNGSTLKVHSIFRTIQGEGPFCGKRAVFVRLAGCNLQCPGCDTTYTGNQVVEMDVDTILHAVLKQGESELVVVTGGEPFRQNISRLCNAIIDRGYIVQVETNGTLPPSPHLNKSTVIVCSPKTGKVHSEIVERATCFKYVLSHDSISEDGLPIRVLGNPGKVYRPRTPVRIYVQPMDSYDEQENNKNLNACINACLQHGYTLQLQLHKLIGVE